MEEEAIMATAVITRLAEIREAYARRRTLWRELDGYMTEGALNDLDAAITRSEAETGADTYELRQVVAAKRTALLQGNR
jgi:hypothetical protein